MNTKLSSWILFATVGAMMLTAVPAFSQEKSESGYKVGVVNRAKVFEECELKKAKDAYLESEKSARDAQLKPLIDAFTNRVKEMNDRVATMSAAERDKWGAERSEKEIEIKAKREQFQNELDRLTATTVRDIADKMQAIIEEIALEQNFHLVLEADTNPNANSPVVYFHSSMDLTSQVLERMNAKFKTSASAGDPASATKKKG